MVSQILPLNAQSNPQLRLMDPTRDLAQIAHVIEVAFADELSPGGHAIMRDLRFLNTFGPLVWFFSRAMPSLRDMFGGYVWEEKGRVVANITLTRLDNFGSNWVISNVAVLPDYRRRGIAHAMMKAAIQYAQLHGGKRIQLQVRHDNYGAKALYEGLGFGYLETITEMFCERVRRTDFLLSRHVRVSEPVPKRWHEAYEVARAAIPSPIQRIRPLRAENFRLYQRTFFERFWNLLLGNARERWWVEVEGRVMALLTIDRQMNWQNERLELLIHPDGMGEVEAALVNKISARLNGHFSTRATITAHFVQARAFLAEAGFRELRTLDQMMLELTPPDVQNFRL